jgi:acyl-coenzyme A thioesterase PaaI-like protein
MARQPAGQGGGGDEVAGEAKGVNAPLGDLGETSWLEGGPGESMKCLQEIHSPQGACFGCGPANPKGLRIRSFLQGDELVCDWQPEPHHLAFEGVLNGGICGALLDCHSNWMAAVHLMRAGHLEAPPCTVTAEFDVKLLRPTPLEATLHLSAKVADSRADRATVLATLSAHGKVTAECRGTFVAVREGHPAFHRW